MENKEIFFSPAEVEAQILEIKKQLKNPDEAALLDGMIKRMKAGTKSADIVLETAKNILEQQNLRETS